MSTGNYQLISFLIGALKGLLLTDVNLFSLKLWKGTGEVTNSMFK